MFWRFDFLSEGSLQIDSVQVSDAGHYLCTASNAVGTDHHKIELQVLGAPIISPAPTNITAVANVQAELSCEASGAPKPEVTWKKNGKPLNFNMQQNMYRLLPSGSLVIILATTQDTALYECVASNEAGDSHRLIQFTVHGTCVPRFLYTGGMYQTMAHLGECLGRVFSSSPGGNGIEAESILDSEVSSVVFAGPSGCSEGP
eukprot:g47123.t1